MKKIAALVMTALLVSSISGCTNRNTGYRNQSYDTNRGINQGTTQGTRTGYGTTNMGITQGTYRDGIYTAEGTRSGNTNQAATVVISGGRITDITLRTIDAQGRDINTNTGTGTTTGTGNTANAPGTGFYGTPGATTGGANGGMSGNAVGAPRGNTGNINGDNGTMSNGIVDGTAGGVNQGWTTGGTGTTAGMGNTDRIRREIATAMINQQTADVALNGNDTREARNWKLAVRRALDKSRTGGTTGGAAGTTTGGTTGTGTRVPASTGGTGGAGR